MKSFAITPDQITAAALTARLPMLKKKGVSFLYLRSPALFDSLDILVPSINDAGILPILPYAQAASCPEHPLGVHFKDGEGDKISKKNIRSGGCVSSSCHDFKTAMEMLSKHADYIFISPVFKPLSKPGDSRDVLPRNSLEKLLAEYGERVVLLGGITEKRNVLLHYLR